MIHKIKALHNEGDGLSIRSIACQLGISRNTVRKYLRMDEAAIGEQQSNRTRHKQLDDYRDYIVTLLGQFPHLSAVKVLRKLKERHPELGVSDRSARRYIKALKETVSLRQKRYYEPVESLPGVQCQVDGGELRGVLLGGEAATVHFVVFVLSYSRLMYAGLSPRPIDTATFIRLHDAAFRYFGGRPEECVYDQTRLVVLHEQYRELELNQAFAAYATAAGFRIHACEGYDPESKGKVEAGVKYVKGNALAGEVFDDWDHLEAHVRQWLDEVANIRRHGTTGEAPQVRFERDEQAQLGPYLTPASLAPQASTETRKVDKTGLLSWRANKYSAPMAYQGSRVGVCAEAGELVLLDLETGREIARHVIAQDKGTVIRNNDHYRDKAARVADLEATIGEQVGETVGARLCARLKATSPRIYKDQLVALRGLLNGHPDLPQGLLERLLERPSLTATQCRDYFEAYAADPGRFVDPPTTSPSPTGHSDQLSGYAAVLPSAQEVPHDLH